MGTTCSYTLYAQALIMIAIIICIHIALFENTGPTHLNFFFRNLNAFLGQNDLLVAHSSAAFQ